MKRALPLIGVLVLLTNASGQAPSGYLTWVDKETGLTTFVPKAYKEIPLQPTESVDRVKLICKTVPRELRQLRARPTMRVFLFRWTDGAATTPGDPGNKPDPEANVPTSIREMMEKSKEVKSFDDFKKKKLAGFEIEPVKGQEGVYELSMKRGPRDRAASRSGWLIIKRQGAAAYGVYAFTVRAHQKAMKRLATKVARHLKLPEGKKAAAAKGKVERELDRLYRNKKYRHIEHRREVRKDLARGWKATDTENYILVYHTKNTKLINRIAKNIEGIRSYYEKLFPPAREVTAVSIVRICANKGEYHAYGGPQGSGGFWHSGNEELVLFDYMQTTLDAERNRERMKQKVSDKDALLVLYHEAFHQYIYYAVGEVAPHDWFNEGHGDFFSGAVITSNGKKVTRIRPSWWRIHRAKDQMEKGKGRVSLKDLLVAERKDYYGPRRSDFYAAGWSFVYFMRNSEVVAGNDQWNGLLDLYFNTLKDEYQKAIERFGPADAAEGEQAKPGQGTNMGFKRMAQREAKAKAINKMMDGLDIPTLDGKWEKFIKKLRDPWPERRARRRD